MATMVARPRRWFSSDYRILEGDREVTHLHLRLLRDRGVFEVEGKEYRIDVEGFFLGRFELLDGTTVLARAERKKRKIEVRTGGHRITLEPRGWLARSFDVRITTGSLGSICSLGWAGFSAEADLPAELALPLRVFLVYLVLVTWRRRAAFAAAAGG
ncbi:hypothetical protein ACFL3S_08995 [Gemmatimonadota bacterium]